METIRLMQEDDYPALIALWRKASGVGIGEGDDRVSFGRFLLRNPNTCFVLVDGDEVVGSILAGNDGRCGYIYHLAVRKTHQGLGFGRTLVGCAMEALDKEGITKVGLLVRKCNSAGNFFWDHLGFTKCDDVSFRGKLIREWVGTCEEKTEK